MFNSEKKSLTQDMLEQSRKNVESVLIKGGAERNYLDAIDTDGRLEPTPEQIEQIKNAEEDLRSEVAILTGLQLEIKNAVVRDPSVLEKINESMRIITSKMKLIGAVGFGGSIAFGAFVTGTIVFSKNLSVSEMRDMMLGSYALIDAAGVFFFVSNYINTEFEQWRSMLKYKTNNYRR
jgi:hypothetical protein